MSQDIDKASRVIGVAGGAGWGHVETSLGDHRVLAGESQSEGARTYGVSQPRISRLMARYRLEGKAAYEPRPPTEDLTDCGRPCRSSSSSCDSARN